LLNLIVLLEGWLTILVFNLLFWACPCWVCWV